VIFTGLLSDRLGSRMALLVFGGVLLLGCVLVGLALWLSARTAAAQSPQLQVRN